MASRRLQRVGSQVAREVGALIERELADPDLDFVTVHSAEVTRDLGVATILVGVIGDADQARASIEALERARHVIRRELGQRLRLRVTPELRFQLDPDMVTEEHLRQTLDRRTDEPGGRPGAMSDRRDA